MRVHDDDTGLPVYASVRDIPWYQRAWIWGTVALLILLCGLLGGWLIKPDIHWVAGSVSPNAEQGGDPGATKDIAAQEAVNQDLRQRIARVEAAMGDICDSGSQQDSPAASGRP